MKVAKSVEQFQKECKPYVANMVKNRKMLHKKNECKDSKWFFEYEDFESIDEALNFYPRINMCQRCFPNQDI